VFWTFVLLASSSAVSFGGILPKAEETTTFVVPGQEGMHRELIPKNISIVHCSYDLDVVAPGTTFGFDIVGSGFDEAFYKIIKVDADALDVTIKNLRLVTANQIHGQIDVGTAATTQYIKPLVIIRSLPVFRAPEPFGVVRQGEVLDMELTSISETGQWGRFRVITNLNEALYKRFKLTPTNTGLELSNFKPNYPFYVEGAVMIGQGLKAGQYGVVAHIGQREVFRKIPLVDVVKPTVGRTGSIDKVEAVQKARRPGDPLELAITGSAFQPSALASLAIQVTPMEMGQGTFTFVSAGRLQASLRIPTDAPVGVYGVSVLHKGKELISERNAFGVVPPNWLSSVKAVGALTPGTTGQLALEGRDIAYDFVGKLQVTTDTEGLKISNLRWVSATGLAADIVIASDVSPGDYLIHVMVSGKEMKLPRGNIVKVTR
jgi:hypothetical protein